MLLNLYGMKTSDLHWQIIRLNEIHKFPYLFYVYVWVTVCTYMYHLQSDAPLELKKVLDSLKL